MPLRLYNPPADLKLYEETFAERPTVDRDEAAREQLRQLARADGAMTEREVELYVLACERMLWAMKGT